MRLSQNSFYNLSKETTLILNLRNHISHINFDEKTANLFQLLDYKREILIVKIKEIS